MAGVIIIQPKQKVTYVVNKDFNYYLQMSEGSSVTFKSKNGGDINLNKNIWGPGNLNFSGSVNANGAIGVAPTKEEIQGLSVYIYTGESIEKEI